MFAVAVAEGRVFGFSWPDESYEHLRQCILGRDKMSTFTVPLRWMKKKDLESKLRVKYGDGEMAEEAFIDMARDRDLELDGFKESGIFMEIKMKLELVEDAVEGDTWKKSVVGGVEDPERGRKRGEQECDVAVG